MKKLPKALYQYFWFKLFEDVEVYIQWQIPFRSFQIKANDKTFWSCDTRRISVWSTTFNAADIRDNDIVMQANWNSHSKGIKILKIIKNVFVTNWKSANLRRLIICRKAMKNCCLKNRHLQPGQTFCLPKDWLI